MAALTVARGDASEPATWRALVRPPWRGVVARAAAVPVLVMLPLLTVAPKVDNRFDIYRWGAEYATRPWRIVPAELAAVSSYLDVGNFRPLGRMFERALNVVTHHLSVSLQLPVPIAMRLVHLLGAAVLSVVLVVVAESLSTREPLRRSQPSRLAQFLPFAFAAGLVAAGSNSTIVMFTDLYLLSTALVLLLALLPARRDWLHQRGLRASAAAAAVVIGAALAAFNEMAYLTVPLALVAVVVRGCLVMGLPWAQLRRSQALLATLVGGFGFAAVFVPVRILIAARCASGMCYSPTVIALDPAFQPAFAARLVAWAPPITWQVATVRVDWAWFVPTDGVTVLLLAGIGLLAWRAVAHARAAQELPVRTLVGVAVFGATLLLLSAGMAGLSETVQRFTTGEDWRHAFAGWRDQHLAVAGGAIVGTAALVAWMQRPGRLTTWLRQRVTIVATALTIFACVSLLANQGYAAVDARLPASTINNRIALSVSEASDQPASNELRCALLDEFAREAPFYRRRMQEALDATMQRRYGLDYCVLDPLPT
jgi:hypothetical protein